MRVITGTARGVPLKAPRGMDTRPTMDQVKEGIFSAIQFEVEGRRALERRSTCLPAPDSSASRRSAAARRTAPLSTRAESRSALFGRT